MTYRKFSLALILASMMAPPIAAEGWQEIGNVTAIQPLPGGATPWWTSLMVTVFGIEGAPRQVTAGGRALTQWKHDAETP